ncbi:MAG: GNAT family N-acetyltransferase [Stenotrophomonas nitritireducens]|uniref:GNAT family N-acetyltransferase n=1 Tax=Stenotrophomonas nitritireducens TaxID=83617 RepID=UPI001AC722A7|nr:GNAT family N-acetyltransferase [Stenotrophomonas nitritireducens]MBN8791789.1 GNAT family N-acetyltransferase [Stenotrophomonas nitritireducens]MBN8795727.1 GNAT family N-acetyltransferase [Stenotrophomonas nitritireducens]
MTDAALADAGGVPRVPAGDDLPALLALNNAHAVELSWQAPDAFARLLDRACFVRCIGAADALLVALDQDARYDNPNFAWLAARHPRFVYIDRVVVAAHARGRGLARRLYDSLIEYARVHGQQRLVCEINAEPPNPASLAFHRGLGFAPIGQARLPGGKTVTYFERVLRA